MAHHARLHLGWNDLGFGEGDVLGSAIGSCSTGTCTWVVLPDSVDKVNGLTIGLTSVFSAATGNIGTVLGRDERHISHRLRGRLRSYLVRRRT